MVKIKRSKKDNKKNYAFYAQKIMMQSIVEKINKYNIINSFVCLFVCYRFIFVQKEIYVCLKLQLTKKNEANFTIT